MAAGIIDLVSDLVQLSTSEDEQDSEDDITSFASPKSTPQSERGEMDSSSKGVALHYSLYSELRPRSRC